MEQKIENGVLRSVEICKACEHLAIFMGESHMKCTCAVENKALAAFCQYLYSQIKCFEVPKQCPYYAEHFIFSCNKGAGK